MTTYPSVTGRGSTTLDVHMGTLCGPGKSSITYQMGNDDGMSNQPGENAIESTYLILG